jgi:hypothetical protein
VRPGQQVGLRLCLTRPPPPPPPPPHGQVH